jgi:hypothetical protein
MARSLKRPRRGDSTRGENDDILSFEWFEDFGLPSERRLREGAAIFATLAIGTHHLALRVTDRTGRTDTDEVSTMFVDTTPPDIAVALEPSVLWPPDHRIVDVEAFVEAEGRYGRASVVVESFVSSEEQDGAGGGDGQTGHDIQGADLAAGDFAFQLRAERSGSSAGRVYQVMYRAIGASGNAVGTTAYVVVPPSRQPTR